MAKVQRQYSRDDLTPAEKAKCTRAANKAAQDAEDAKLVEETRTSGPRGAKTRASRAWKRQRGSDSEPADTSKKRRTTGDRGAVAPSSNSQTKRGLEDIESHEDGPPKAKRSRHSHSQAKRKIAASEEDQSHHDEEDVDRNEDTSEDEDQASQDGSDDNGDNNEDVNDTPPRKSKKPKKSKKSKKSKKPKKKSTQLERYDDDNIGDGDGDNNDIHPKANMASNSERTTAPTAPRPILPRNIGSDSDVNDHPHHSNDAKASRSSGSPSRDIVTQPSNSRSPSQPPQIPSIPASKRVYRRGSRAPSGSPELPTHSLSQPLPSLPGSPIGRTPKSFSQPVITYANRNAKVPEDDGNNVDEERGSSPRTSRPHKPAHSAIDDAFADDDSDGIPRQISESGTTEDEDEEARDKSLAFERVSFTSVTKDPPRKKTGPTVSHRQALNNFNETLDHFAGQDEVDDIIQNMKDINSGFQMPVLSDSTESELGSPPPVPTKSKPKESSRHSRDMLQPRSKSDAPSKSKPDAPSKSKPNPRTTSNPKPNDTSKSRSDKASKSKSGTTSKSKSGTTSKTKTPAVQQKPQTTSKTVSKPRDTNDKKKKKRSHSQQRRDEQVDLSHDEDEDADHADVEEEEAPPTARVPWPRDTDITRSRASGHVNPGEQSDRMKAILECAAENAAIVCLFTHAYPEYPVKLNYLRQNLIEAALECDDRVVAKRFKHDQKYFLLAKTVPETKLSFIRGKVKKNLVACVSTTYGLKAGCARRVRHWLEDDAYINAGDDLDSLNNKLPFQNNAIFQGLATSFFSGNSSLAFQYIDSFKVKRPNGVFFECPPCLVALVTTAIEAILREWQTGSYSPSKFLAAVYAPTFNRHMLTLKGIEDENPDSYHAMMARLYRKASNGQVFEAAAHNSAQVLETINIAEMPTQFDSEEE